MLKPLADSSNVASTDYVDWGHEEEFATAIGVGECAGVQIDLVRTLLFDAEEKADSAAFALEEERFADAIYFAYTALVHGAKALLIDKGVRCNTQVKILTDFDLHFANDFGFDEHYLFSEFVLRMNKSEPTEEFANVYVNQLLEVFNRLKESYGNEEKK